MIDSRPPDLRDHEPLAAVDLGSNSFHMIVARFTDGGLQVIDRLRDPVRMAAGLTPDGQLTPEIRERALGSLARFGQRLRGIKRNRIRAVATNTVRQLRNPRAFLMTAETALGAPIEVVSGREEARLIYLGVAHTLPNPSTRQLVVDIGGGSTEFIIGRNFRPDQLESLYMGCVSYSLRFFPEGRVTREAMRRAELAARTEVAAIAQAYRRTGWQEAVGSSGTAKAITDLLELNGLNPEGATGITRHGLHLLRDRLVKAGGAARLSLDGLRPDRIPVLPGGLAIMCGVFEELGLERMVFSEGALRLGVLYDLLGRYHHDDLREATVTQFMARYGVDRPQAGRVAETAHALLCELDPACADPDHPDARFLSWASWLHEIGISIAHTSYHKHSAYVLDNADMPGFSRRDQRRLSHLVLAHRGKLERLRDEIDEPREWMLIFCLRTAAVLHRSRSAELLPQLGVSVRGNGYRLVFERAWLHEAPLTAAALTDETRQWGALGIDLQVQERRSAK